jgi:succinate dehydrogenase / fumarate reductase cytochrome b subunit
MNDRNYFVLKRLHSLSGVVPTAGFVVFHLFENSKSVAGPAAFNETVATLRGMPYLYLLEIGLLAPIFFHAFLGIYLSFRGKSNVFQYQTRANVSYTLQRLTGLGLFLFILFHLYNTRFAGIASDHMFQHMAEGYSNPLILGGYLLGIAATAFHLSNGLWGFACAWGIVTGEKSMDAAWKLCMGLGLAIFLMGSNAAFGFLGKGVDIFQHDKAPKAEMAAPVAPAPAPASAPAPAPQAKH